LLDETLAAQQVDRLIEHLEALPVVRED